MRRIFLRISYRMRIAIVITLFALIPLSLFGGYYLKNEWTNWQMNTVEKYSQILYAGSEQLDSELQEIQSKLIYISNVFSIRTALSGIADMDLVEGLDFVSLLRDTVESVTIGDKYLVVRWYTPYHVNYGGYTYSLDELAAEMADEDMLYDEILSLNAGKMFRIVREIERDSSTRDGVQRRFCAYAKITSLRNPDSLLEMSLPLESLVNIENDDFPEGSVLGIYLELDHGGQTFLLSEDTEGSRELLEEYRQTGKCQGYYPIASKIDSFSDSTITCLIPKGYVLKQMSDHIISYAMIILLFLLTVVSCSYVASAMLTKRVVHFIEKMNGELDTILEGSCVTGEDESDIRSIETRICELIKSTQEYYVRMEQAEMEKSRLELEILQMRINPHFLYNTLTSIRYQIKETRIRRSLDSLIHYYRIVLSKGHLFIKIEEELSMIREYLELQVFAYRLENIQYVIEADESVKSYTIIKHLLQPIVENALEHGLRSKDGTGMIRIRARVDEKDVIFEIEDNGIGMNPEKIEHILTEPENGSEGGGYGIYNVQQRIQTYYGADYGITFDSKEGEGTCVTLKIPQNKME